MTTLDSRLVALEAAPAARGEPTDARPRRWKWTGDDLIRMGEAGLLPPEGRFELLGGELYQLMPPGPLHAFIVGLIRALLDRVARDHGSHVREEKPIRLSEEYDPQPDVAVVRGDEQEYRDRFPGPGDVLLVVEVADSSLDHDRTLKVPAYAAAGIPECWLVNLPDGRVEAYREPVEGEYRARHTYRRGDTLAAQALPGTTLTIAALLGDPQEEPAA